MQDFRAGFDSRKRGSALNCYLDDRRNVTLSPRELWDLYDSEGRPLGRAGFRGVPLKEGEYHLVVQAWVRNADGEYLIQKRAADLASLPGMWATTAGSAIPATCPRGEPSSDWARASLTKLRFLPMIRILNRGDRGVRDVIGGGCDSLDTRMANRKQIIAMGGGGFSMEPDDLLLDHYILGAAGRKDPAVCFLPTASGDSADYIVRFYSTFSKLPCRPHHLSLFRQPRDLKSAVEECDVIYVGGGNTRNMLAIWKSCGLDALLLEVWERGVVLCGLSAGAICWFECGHTDSAGTLNPMKCLGFLKGSCTPHYDGEGERRGSYHTFLESGELPAGYALDDGAAVHFVGGELAEMSPPEKRRGLFVCNSRMAG